MPIRTPFPSHIGNFRYHGPLESAPRASAFKFAVYQNKQGKQVVMKLWTGKYQSRSYFEMRNEINVYKELNQILKSHRTDIKKKFPTISIPTLYHSHISETTAYFTADKVSGSLLGEQPAQIIMAADTKIISYFSFLSHFLNFSTSKVQTKTFWQYLILFHFYLVKGISVRPQATLKIVKFLPAFYFGFIPYLFSSEKTFVHRDLGGYNNVIINGNNLNVIDFQISAITHPMVEVANLLVSKWNNQKFTNCFFVSPLFKKVTREPKAKRLFKSLVIYGVVFDISNNQERPISNSLALLTRASSI